MDLAKKLLGALLAVVGAALLVIGLWFAVHLGGSGTATFELRPSAAPVVLEPSVLNRLDEPTTVTVTPASGQQVWVGVGAPSDVTALVGRTPAQHVTSVVIRDWALVSHTTGTGSPVTPSSAEMWQETHTGTSPVTVTLDQANAPQAVVVSADTGSVQRIEVSWSHRTWFVQAVVVAVVGLLVLLAGLATALSGLRRRRRPAEPAADATTEQEAAA